MTAALVGLLTESRQQGFLGPGPVTDHIAHARAFAGDDIEAPARALDLGAGGGLPGLVLAVTDWPETTWCLLDGQLRRTRFLEHAVQVLGLASQVRVVHARAEAFGQSPAERSSYDVVVARSFGAPAVVAECACALLRVGGSLLVSEPPDVSAAVRWPGAATAALGFGPVRSVAVDRTGGDCVHLARLELERPGPARYPRRDGLPARRPLF